MRRRISQLVLVWSLLALVLSQGQQARATGSDPGQAPAFTLVPTLITIPAINLVAEVVPVGYELAGKNLAWQTADDAVGWHRSSAMPGSPGNTVMSGHNASLGSGVFRRLHRVRLGDTITVTVNGEKYGYIVTDRAIFRHLFTSAKRRANNATWLGAFGDERLTLITCYPWYTNTHRLVVVAHPIEATTTVRSARTLR